ncbi:MAG: class I SAM-dependent methyltransferase [Nocardioidaceae bacterium]
MDADVLDFLLRPVGQRLLNAASSWYDDVDPLALNLRLRGLDGGYRPDEVAAALTLVGLRRAAVSKFGPAASRLYLTAAGLEQATHPVVARHRARRTHDAGLRACLDLGCGIGSDLMAFAGAGLAVTGVEQDGVTARMAAANLEVSGLAGTVVSAAAESVDRAAFDLVFADPSRRRGSARVFDPAAFSPPWTFVASLLEGTGSGAPVPQHAVVKLAPGLDHALIGRDVEAEWVSLDGQLRETALWSPAPTVARRRATVLGTDGSLLERTEEDAPLDAPPVARVGRYLYEPDPALIRAHLVSVAAAEVDGWLLDPHIAYVCSDREVQTGLAACYRVLEVLPYQEKRLRAALRQRGIGALTIKKRGIAVTPEVLRRRLGLTGQRQATLVVTRTPQSAVALLVDPVT